MFRVWGFGVLGFGGLGSRSLGFLGLRVLGFGVLVLGVGFAAWGLGSTQKPQIPVPHACQGIVCTPLNQLEVKTRQFGSQQGMS